MIIGRQAPILAQAARDAYTAPPTWIGAAPGMIMRAVLGTVRAVRTKIDGLNIIAIPGTDDVEKLMLDFLIGKVAVVGHPEFGRLHFGFAASADALTKAITSDLGDEPYLLTGHSFGGAVAQPLALMMPHPPLGIMALAPARVFADEIPPEILAITAAYRFGNDPIPDSPEWFPSVPCAPIGTANAVNPMECHHVANYVAALS